MTDLQPFGLIILLIALALVGAVMASRLSERIRVPTPALFLLAAAAAAEAFPRLGTLSLQVDERLVTVALIFILFDGGLEIGWPAFRAAAGAVIWVGVAGTLVTALSLALVAHVCFGFSWYLALLLGTALAPTDPAAVFAVLGRREVVGRTDTILKGEAGVNDPVGIALMVVLLGTGGSGVHGTLQGVWIFAEQMVIGIAVGAVGGWALLHLIRRVPLPNEALYPVRTLACAAAIYGAAQSLDGSGFMAVLLAGIICGDARAPYKREIERFASGLGSIAEILAFTVLGLTVHLGGLTLALVATGLAIAAILGLVVRPLLLGLLMVRIDLTRGERLFILWSGLKGAVPILLGIFVLEADVAGAQRLYDVLFVVVLTSVVVQGGLVPWMADKLHVPMHTVELEPWALGMRFRTEPQGLQRHFVAAGSPAEGSSVADLDLGEDAWISMVSRRGELVNLRGNTTLEAGDEVLILGHPGSTQGRLFERPSAPGARD